jgi:hypothetical protein
MRFNIAALFENTLPVPNSNQCVSSVPFFQQAISFDSHNAQAYGWLGMASLLQNRYAEASRDLLQAADLKGGFTRSLDAFVQAEQSHKGTFLMLTPVGLAEYEYVLALRAADDGDWNRSLEHIEWAIDYRPGPWPEDFYTHYREVLGQVAPEIVERMSLEEAAVPAAMPQIKVGRKDQPGWETPIRVTDSWQLQGFTVRSWTAFDHGFPATVGFFWQNGAGQLYQQTVRIWNRLSNGGFELGTASHPNHLLGWFKPTYALRSLSSVPLGVVWRQGITSTVLLSRPTGPEHNDDTLARLIRVQPQTYLLWHAWIDNSNNGNPHIFVEWRDARQKPIKPEIPMQGNASGTSGDYAGVLQVPDNAMYMALNLTNWKSSGEVLWDNLLLLPLTPPAP